MDGWLPLTTVRWSELISGTLTNLPSPALSSECHRFPAVPGRVCREGGGSDLHQGRPAGRDVPEPPQRHHPPGPPQRHGLPLVAQPQGAARQNALPPGRRTLHRRRQDRDVSH